MVNFLGALLSPWSDPLTFRPHSFHGAHIDPKKEVSDATIVLETPNLQEWWPPCNAIQFLNIAG